jgi:hypothetical protein
VRWGFRAFALASAFSCVGKKDGMVGLLDVSGIFCFSIYGLISNGDTVKRHKTLLCYAFFIDK